MKKKVPEDFFRLHGENESDSYDTWITNSNEAHGIAHFCLIIERIGKICGRSAIYSVVCAGSNCVGLNIKFPIHADRTSRRFERRSKKKNYSGLICRAFVVLHFVCVSYSPIRFSFLLSSYNIYKNWREEKQKQTAVSLLFYVFIIIHMRSFIVVVRIGIWSVFGWLWATRFSASVCVHAWDSWFRWISANSNTVNSTKHELRTVKNTHTDYSETFSSIQESN